MGSRRCLLRPQPGPRFPRSLRPLALTGGGGGTAAKTSRDSAEGGAAAGGARGARGQRRADRAARQSGSGRANRKRQSFGSEPISGRRKEERRASLRPVRGGGATNDGQYGGPIGGDGYPGLSSIGRGVSCARERGGADRDWQEC
ncbi:unnamed protein product [Coccothraustes coccothraustes]